MTQKRLIKLFMANGCPRNDARYFARCMVEFNDKRSAINHGIRMRGDKKRLELLTYKRCFDEFWGREEDEG